MRQKIKFEVVDLLNLARAKPLAFQRLWREYADSVPHQTLPQESNGSGYGVYIKPRGSNLGEWQVESGLMFYPVVGWRS